MLKMVKEYNPPPQDKDLLISTSTALPTNRPIAVYYRQSTDGQIGNISTTMQTVDMVSYLESQGWNEENIVLIDMDGGVSGTTRIDERDGMRYLFDLITEKQIGAVACQDEDRLFRDITQIQVNIFIQACRENDVIVITPTMVYQFGNPSLYRLFQENNSS
jgi:DNA invertase Pin-like site-specific DNA recombinase